MKRPSSILFVILLLALLVSTSDANTTSKPPLKVVMVVIPTLSLDDLDADGLTALRTLADSGALGLMNTRTAGRLDRSVGLTSVMYTPESGYLTLGAGARAITGPDAALAFNRAETVEGTSAKTVYERLTMMYPGSSEVVHTGIARLLRESRTLGYSVKAGLIGDELHAAGLTTAVVGNSDDEGPHREAATICMDSRGLVDFGNVAVADGPEFLSEVARCVAKADFTVIELGDLARLERVRLDLMDGVYRREHLLALRRTDAMLASLIDGLDLRNTVLVVLSPYPSRMSAEEQGNRMCPVLVAGEGVSHGLLVSGSTRVSGVPANIDIAPSVLEWLGVESPPDIVGRPVTVSAHPSPLSALRDLQDRIALQSVNQPVLRQGAVVIIIIIGAVTLLWLAFPGSLRLRRRFFQAVVLLPTALAPAALLSAMIPMDRLWLTWVGLAFGAMALTAISLALGRKPLNALMMLCLGLSFTILLDLIVGGRLLRFSIMSFSIMDGSRYYGIGNESMGALVGSSLIGMGLLLGALHARERVTRAVLACGLVLEVAVVGSSLLGANVGGAISAVTAFGIAIAVTYSKPLAARKVLGVGLCIASALIIFALLDSLRGPERESHLGRAVRLALSGGLWEMAVIAKRKLAMNLQLIQASAWSRLLAAAFISMAVVLKTGGDRLRSRPMALHSRVALAGALSGILAALVFNDSGVVAAGTGCVYLWALVLLTAMEADAADRG